MILFLAALGCMLSSTPEDSAGGTLDTASGQLVETPATCDVDPLLCCTSECAAAEADCLAFGYQSADACTNWRDNCERGCRSYCGEADCGDFDPWAQAGWVE